MVRIGLGDAAGCPAANTQPHAPSGQRINDWQRLARAGDEPRVSARGRLARRLLSGIVVQTTHKGGGMSVTGDTERLDAASHHLERIRSSIRDADLQGAAARLERAMLDHATVWMSATDEWEATDHGRHRHTKVCKLRCAQKRARPKNIDLN